ncbi:hypothetical protein ACQEU3_37015 [Spirillospora sp. CA-253888]
MRLRILATASAVGALALTALGPAAHAAPWGGGHADQAGNGALRDSCEAPEIFLEEVNLCVMPDDDPNKRKASAAAGPGCVWKTWYKDYSYNDGDSAWSMTGTLWKCNGGKWVKGASLSDAAMRVK